jgi:hypothetical protein
LIIIPIFAFVIEVGVLDKKLSSKEELKSISQLQNQNNKMGSYLQLQEKDIQDSSSDIRSKD